MPSVTKSVGTGTNEDRGNPDWANPDRITSSNNIRTSVTLSAGQASDFLNGTMAGNLFAVPLAAVINNVQVRAERQASGIGILFDVVKLLKNGVRVGPNKAGATEFPTSDAYASWNWSPSDVFLIPADVNAGDFGVSIAATNHNSFFSRVAEIDHIEIIVDFTLAISPESIPSGELVGLPILVLGGVVQPESIPSAESVGLPQILQAQSVQPLSIGAQEKVGSPSLLYFVPNDFLRDVKVVTLVELYDEGEQEEIGVPYELGGMELGH